MAAAMAYGPQLVHHSAALGVPVLAPAATGPGDLQCGPGGVSEKNLGSALEVWGEDIPSGFIKHGLLENGP